MKQVTITNVPVYHCNKHPVHESGTELDPPMNICINIIINYYITTLPSYSTYRILQYTKFLVILGNCHEFFYTVILL